MAEKKLRDLDDDMYDDEEDESIDDMYLTFELGNEIYGIEIGFVTEIVGVQKITLVPDMPDYMKGVVNLRGNVIPVIDMRLRFGMEARDYDERTCFVVIDIDNTQMTIVVDTVSEVVTIEEENVSAPPAIASAGSKNYIKGMARVGEDVKILLDGHKILFDEEITSLITE